MLRQNRPWSLVKNEVDLNIGVGVGYGKWRECDKKNILQWNLSIADTIIGTDKKCPLEVSVI